LAWREIAVAAAPNQESVLARIDDFRSRTGEGSP